MSGASREPEEVRAGRRTMLRRRLGHADLSAVPEVRGALRELLDHWGGDGPVDVAELLTSELVTNALVHTDRGAVVTATVVDERLRVEVRDFIGVLPKVHEAAAGAGDGTHGRGLVLVQSLADAWGVRSHGIGKVVWFELNCEGPAQA
ncbi:ATP-binding protein [Streptomyces sp. NPDC050504]|uniref:ATP-binding protein n=1 Tax=Streptomyces sp. NPDC050504 TaxID=3365618 RepID=UPI00379A12F2